MPSLRVEFTNYIYQKIILQDKSINIIGEDGVGKSRLVEDLRDKLQNSQTTILSIDIKALRRDFDKFIKELNNQLNINLNSFEEIMDNFYQKEGQKLFFIKNFEYFYKRGDRDSRFDFNFFESLNSFKNRASTSLVILSTKHYNHYLSDINRDTSPLDLNYETITPLHKKEILEELKREVEPKYSDYFERIAKLIELEERNYALLEFIINEIENRGVKKSPSIDSQFYYWKKRFEKKEIPKGVKLYWWLAKKTPLLAKIVALFIPKIEITKEFK